MAHTTFSALDTKCFSQIGGDHTLRADPKDPRKTVADDSLGLVRLLPEKREAEVRKQLTESQLRRRKQRQLKKPLIHRVVVPSTAGERRIPQRPYTIDTRVYVRVEDFRGGLHVAYWAPEAGMFSCEALNTLSQETTKLRAVIGTKRNR